MFKTVTFSRKLVFLPIFIVNVLKFFCINSVSVKIFLHRSSETFFAFKASQETFLLQHCQFCRRYLRQKFEFYYLYL